MWKKAQSLELDVWRGEKKNNDRADTHISYFDRYKSLENHHFGKTLEIGCGPWTQLMWIADTLSTEKLGLEKTTLLEPNGENYMREVPTCSYKDGTLLGKPIHLLPIGGEELNAVEQFDTVISINVLDHVQDLLQVLNNTYHAVKPGGLLIWNDRWFDSPFGCRTSKDYMGISLHPMRPKFKVFSHFLSFFEPIYQKIIVERMDSTATGPECDGGQIYFIGRKKQ
jgi:SAM-dependent methyltransferase